MIPKCHPYKYIIAIICRIMELITNVDKKLTIKFYVVSNSTMRPNKRLMSTPCDASPTIISLNLNQGKISAVDMKH